MADETPKFPEPQLVTAIKTDRQMSMVRFAPSGNLLVASGRDATIRRWDMTRTETPPEPPPSEEEKKKKKDPKPPEPVYPELPPLAGHNGWVTGIAFHPQEPRLFSADSWGELVCWTYTDKEAQPVWKVNPAHDGWIRQMSLSPDGQRLATCGKDRKVCVWNTADGSRLQELTGNAEDVYSVAFHPDGKSLVSGDLKGMARQWDLESGKSVREFDATILYMLSMIQEVGGARVLAFNREGTVLACAGTQPAGGGFVQGTPVVRFFDWASGNETQTLKLGDNTDVYVQELTFHPQGFWIGATSGQPGKGKLFFLRPGEQQPALIMTKLANCHSIGVHPDGKRLAVVSNAGIFGQALSKAREGDYPGNWSPINIMDLASPA